MAEIKENINDNNIEGNDDTKLLDIIKLKNDDNDLSFQTDINILTKSNQNVFTFKGYPNINPNGSDPKNICDEVNRLNKNDWRVYGYQTKQDNNGIAYVEIDLKTRYFITKFAVSGYPGGAHKPVGIYNILGSKDGQNWDVIGSANTGTWTNDQYGTYPFRCINTVTKPDFYQYYRIQSNGFDNQHLLIMNLGLFTPVKSTVNKWYKKEYKYITNDDSKYGITMEHWTTKNLVHWISNPKYVNWGKKLKERNNCITEIQDFEANGKDFIKMDAKAIQLSFNVNVPLMVQRIMNAKNDALKDNNIIRQVIIDSSEQKNDNDIKKPNAEQILIAEPLNFCQSWQDYSNEYQGGRWTKIGKIVIIEGLVKSNNFNGSKKIAILPDIVRPAKRLIFDLNQHNESFRVDIKANGEIEWIMGNNRHNWISLGGIVYMLDTPLM